MIKLSNINNSNNDQNFWDIKVKNEKKLSYKIMNNYLYYFYFSIIE